MTGGPHPGTLVLMLLAAGQEPELHSGQPLDLQLAGGSASVRYEVSGPGWVYVHVLSDELDPRLVVEDFAGEVLGRDEDAGGGTTPHLALSFDAPTRLRIRVEDQAGSAQGRVALHLRELPADAQASELARSVRTRLQAASAAELLALCDDLLAAPNRQASWDVHWTLFLLGSRAYQRADLETCDRAWTAVADFWATVMPPGDRRLVGTTFNLGLVRMRRGDLLGARELQQRAMASAERARPPEDEELLTMRGTHAALLRRLGLLEESRTELEAVVEARANTRSADHPDLLNAQLNLAVTLTDLGDLRAARGLLAAVLVIREEALPGTHPDLQVTRLNQARVLRTMGDWSAARELYLWTLAASEEAFPAESEELLEVRSQLAYLLLEMGEPEAALAHLEEVAAVRVRVLPEGHADRANAEINLGLALARAGETERASALLENAASTLEARLPEHHRQLLTARTEWARALQRAGELERARSIQERVLDLRMAHAALGDPERLAARGDLARTLAGLGLADALTDQLLKLARGARSWVEGGATLSRREATERAASAFGHVSTLMSLAPHCSGEREVLRETWTTIERAHSIATQGCWVPGGGPSREVADLQQRAFELRLEIQELSARTWDEEVRDLDLFAKVIERDGVETELRERMREAGQLAPAIELETLAGKLTERSAAAGFVVYRRFDPAAEDAFTAPEPAWLAALVLGADGSLTRVDLGSLGDLEELVETWRAELVGAAGRGAPVDASHGPIEPRSSEAGEAVRAAILDPVWEAAGKIERLHLRLAGPAQLLPLDVLPLGEGLVGHQVRIRRETSFDRLLAAPVGLPPRGALLAVGAPDFGPGGGDGAFEPLPGTAGEVLEVADLFRERFGEEPTLLTGEGATRAAVLERAGGAGILHLATHGTFGAATQHGSSRGIPVGPGVPRPMAEGAVIHLAPMTLSGLALAGANGALDSRGRAPGRLSAEEIAGLDLGACRLAVLSACDTYLGRASRADLTLESLQAALHAAGVRTTVTSLWKVPDEATRELMVSFYRRLWLEDETPARALWGARMELRERGLPLAEWGAWVLTGDPD